MRYIQDPGGPLSVAAADDDARSEEGRAEGEKGDAGEENAHGAAGEEKDAPAAAADDGPAPMDVDAGAGPSTVRSTTFPHCQVTFAMTFWLHGGWHEPPFRHASTQTQE